MQTLDFFGICRFPKQYFGSFVDMVRVMAESHNASELLYTWREWHDSTGPHMRKSYRRYIELSNEAAKLNGFQDTGDMWRADFEDPKFLENMLAIWKQVEPFYDRLHKYTHEKLLETYRCHMKEKDPLIPAHLLGNMWGQSWVNLYESIKPFKQASEIDITASLQVRTYVITCNRT